MTNRNGNDYLKHRVFYFLLTFNILVLIRNKEQANMSAPGEVAIKFFILEVFKDDECYKTFAPGGVAVQFNMLVLIKNEE